MYLNLYQKYMLELLGEYGGMPKRQLEFMTKFFVEKHLRDVNGYVAQLAMFRKVTITNFGGEEIVTLPGHYADDDVIASVDIMLEFAKHITFHKRGRDPIAVQFYIAAGESETKEINICPVHRGMERSMAEYAEGYAKDLDEPVNGKSTSWVFLIDSKSQIKLIKPDVSYSFAMKTDKEIVFYDGQ